MERGWDVNAPVSGLTLARHGESARAIDCMYVQVGLNAVGSEDWFSWLESSKPACGRTSSRRMGV